MARISQEELVEKATITADSLAAAGKLNPAQANRFLDFVFDETTLSKVARVVRFRNEQLEIDKIGIGRRAAMPKSEAIDPGRRRGIRTSKISLQPKEIIVPFEIGDIFTEINLEGKSVQDHIMQMFAKQLNNDLEEFYCHGDTTGPLATEDEVYDTGSDLIIEDTLLKLGDGWLKRADGGHTLDAEGQLLSIDFFADMLRELPSKFRRNKRDLVFICSDEFEIAWRQRVAARGTAQGDAALNGQGTMTPMGIPLMPVPLMDHYVRITETVTFTGAGSTVSLGYKPIVQGSVVVAPNNVTEAAPKAAYVEDTDYTIDYDNGTITHIGVGSGGSIGANATVRMTYRALPQVILTPRSNLVVAIGRDIRMEKDRDIYRGVDQFAMTVKADCNYEELDAVVKGFNVLDRA